MGVSGNTAVEFINHASVLVSGNGVAVLSDPWYQGEAFHKGWDLLQPTSDADVSDLLKRTTHIWLSHEHPDHFSVRFWKTFAAQIKEQGIEVLFQETKDKRVISFLRDMGLNCRELPLHRAAEIAPDVSVTCIKDGFIDSGLLLTIGEEKILNLNDCEVTTAPRAREVHGITGDVDLLLTQFSYAAWKGGRANRKWRVDAAREKLETVALQVDTFKPKRVIPFASFVYFSNEENVYLNDGMNRPEAVVDALADHSCDVVIMKPGDVLGGLNEDVNTARATEYWKPHIDKVMEKALHTYELVTEEDIRSAFEVYRARIAAKNNLGFIRVLRRVSPIRAFHPISVRVTDLGVTLLFDYVTGDFERTEEVPMLEMRAEPLRFLLANSYGFDTLMVNGCFEEGRSGGFTLAAKTLGIENLNNVGIRMAPGTLLNWPFIKMAMTRLYRVARKLDA